MSRLHAFAAVLFMMSACVAFSEMDYFETLAWLVAAVYAAGTSIEVKP